MSEMSGCYQDIKGTVGLWFCKPGITCWDFEFRPRDYDYYDTGIPMTEFELTGVALFRDLYNHVKAMTLADGRSLRVKDMISAGKLFGEHVMGMLHDELAFYDLRLSHRHRCLGNKLIIFELGIRTGY